MKKQKSKTKKQNIFILSKKQIYLLRDMLEGDENARIDGIELIDKILKEQSEIGYERRTRT